MFRPKPRNFYIVILTYSTYFPPVCTYCEFIVLCSSPLTCQSFSTRKIATQCISSCEFKLSLTYVRTYMHHIQHPLTVKCLTLQTCFTTTFHLLSNTMIVTLCINSSLSVSLFLLLLHTYLPYRLLQRSRASV